MKIKYRYGSPIKERLLVLEDPGQPLLFDADRDFVVDMSSRHNVASMAEEVKGKGPKKAPEELRRLGREVMASAIELADGKYLDRTGEMVEKVAQQTGIHFPHRLQRYVEMSIIGPRPLDRWNVAASTVDELRMQVFSCALAKALQEAGVSTEGTPCREYCLAGLQVAAEKCGLKLKATLEKSLAADNVCEFCFRPMARARPSRAKSTR
jgi:hypothetical protein